MAILASAVFATVGIFSVVGGAIGYKKAGSKASLIAGGVSGVLALTAAGLAASGSVIGGLVLGGATCVALAGRFLPAYLSTKKVMPAGVMSALAVCGILTSLVGFLTR